MNDVLPTRSRRNALPNCLPLGIEVITSCPREGPWPGAPAKSQTPSKLPLGYDPQKEIILHCLYCCSRPDTQRDLRSRPSYLDPHIFRILLVFLPEYRRCLCIYILLFLSSFIHPLNKYVKYLLCARCCAWLGEHE